MRFGVYTSVDDAAAVRAAGYDFVEENVQDLLQGLLPDERWEGAGRATRAVLPVPAANRLVPAQLKITGPDADPDKLRAYMTNVLTRAGRTGTTMLVFGSGPARRVPDGFDRGTARRQVLAFLRMALPIAQANGVTIVAEHMNRGESNLINSIAEAMGYVSEIGHPNFQCLLDSYHFWLEDEPLESLRDAMPWIRHVHVRDTEGVAAPGLTGKNDYRPLLRALRKGGYDGMITVEAENFDVPKDGGRVLRFLRREWDAA